MSNKLHTALRLPDFIIIGAAKSGTTTLFRWLGQQPEFWLPAVKESNFFASSTWPLYVSWYTELFSGAHTGHLTGEASPIYTSSTVCQVAAERIADMVPNVKLIYLIRHPIDRLRSHYRHEVQRSRESAPLWAALRKRDNPYIGTSLYYTCLLPYVKVFPRSQICVVRFEDLVSEQAPAWSRVLSDLGVRDRPAPRTPYNVTAEKRQYTRTMLKIWETPFSRSLLLGPIRRIPRPIRHMGIRLLTRSGPAYSRRLHESMAAVPDDISDQIWHDISRLESWLGTQQPLWVRTTKPRS